ncbi:hemerythrin domain-containing protein [Microbacterium sp. NEAU-LLC]|uniref:Hemerythrin domain-containing protein n=1 Tax=Microbacterium helvum TaxID=2773713 RepID=A0ABR8NMK7_9MICO|nr:hemerythrin domain-containing protein [Microbacterium helvum]MBD3941663.1 hemerythrin domain-containing protein [Microbacterium helvum]
MSSLPSSGDMPEGQHPGCDTSGLILVHRIFRWLYRELPQLVREVDGGDVGRAAVVGRYAHLDFYALHMHHETEDIALWDRLAARDPGCAVHVEQMRAQHAEVASHLAGIEPQLVPWMEAADPALRDAFASDIESLRDTLQGHLRQEEEDIVPVADAVLSQQEWDWMEEHTRQTLAAHRKELGKRRHVAAGDVAGGLRLVALLPTFVLEAVLMRDFRGMARLLDAETRRAGRPRSSGALGPLFRPP